MLKKLVVGIYQTNCYLLGCEKTGEGVVIDPGDEVLRIVKLISEAGLRIRAILITHGHFDHTGAADELRRITGSPIRVHSSDAGALGFRADTHLSDGEEISVGRFKVKVLHTPGHSPGGVSFCAPGAVFSGDTLFAGSVGRTDFAGGDHHGLVRAVVEKIFPLGDHIRVYPGHGPVTTVGQERHTNPFFRPSP